MEHRRSPVPRLVRDSGRREALRAREADDRVRFDIHGIVSHLKGETSVGDHPRFLHRMRVQGHLCPLFQPKFINEERLNAVIFSYERSGVHPRAMIDPVQVAKTTRRSSHRGLR
jgi:hypothetical protein